MNAGASVQLLKELDRQLDLVPSVKQDATTNSKSPRGEVIITLCDQGDPHRLLLSSLRENLLGESIALGKHVIYNTGTD